ncbi:NUDIX domain-containing protein [Streptomyces sp. RerS4]|nr:NUDIX domain-containing protein [Streptomyces sp. RerS4]
MREDGRVLAIRRADNGTWEPPGGVLELAETPEAGVRREVLEETGIHVDVDNLTGVYKNVARGIVARVFRCEPSGGTEHVSDESTAVHWLTPEEVSERMSEVYAIRLLGR